jgi:hypothetical protein
MSRDDSEDQLEPEVVERLEREMAPIEEALRRRLMEKAEEDISSHLARVRDDLKAQGLDGERLEDKLRDKELDFRAEKDQLVEEASPRRPRSAGPLSPPGSLLHVHLRRSDLLGVPEKCPDGHLSLRP